MAKDAFDLGIQSPAADYVKTQTFDYNGHTYHGYIGTRDQLQYLITNYNEIYAALTSFGYTGNYYSTNI